MADISDREIQATALFVIKQHGVSAGYFAARRADQLAERVRIPALGLGVASL